jgi:hypothetical protein
MSEFTEDTHWDVQFRNKNGGPWQCMKEDYSSPENAAKGMKSLAIGQIRFEFRVVQVYQRVTPVAA